MATLLLNLRDVPDDEADEVRALFAQHHVDWYETKPSFWGVSAGGLWVKEADEARRARVLLADYQRDRGERMRAQRAEDLRAGRIEGTWAGMRARPLQTLAIGFGILLMVIVTLLPYLLF